MRPALELGEILSGNGHGDPESGPGELAALGFPLRAPIAHYDMAAILTIGESLATSSSLTPIAQASDAFAQAGAQRPTSADRPALSRCRNRETDASARLRTTRRCPTRAVQLRWSHARSWQLASEPPVGSIFVNHSNPRSGGASTPACTAAPHCRLRIPMPVRGHDHRRAVFLPIAFCNCTY